MRLPKLAFATARKSWSAVRTRGVRLLILPVPLIVAACSETKLPAVDPTVSSERVLSSLTGPDSSWNHISVDITVRREGDARHKPFRSRPATQFRLEKTLADAGWTTQVTMVGKLRTTGDSATISSVVFDPQGSIARAFDAYGREVKVPKASHARMSYAEFGTLIGSVSTKGATAAAASLTAGSAVESGEARRIDNRQEPNLDRSTGRHARCSD